MKSLHPLLKSLLRGLLLGKKNLAFKIPNFIIPSFGSSNGQYPKQKAKSEAVPSDKICVS